MQKERQSAFELLRIIAQIMIVYYHILLIGIYPTSGIPFYKALWLPLHIGVPLFVMISGYFEIKPSVRGFVKLIGLVFVLSLPVMVMDYLEVGGGKIYY
jgi:surface polysaccharide O-acyltransferase-like enzyme